MTMRTSRAIAAATAAAIALTSLQIVPAAAAPAKQVSAQNNDGMEFSGRRYRRGSNAAAFGMFAMTLGTIAAVAAANRHRDAYYYGQGPYYAPGPYAYGAYPYAGYRGPHHWRHHW